MFEAEMRGRAFLHEKGMDDRIIDFKNTDITAESTALALDVDVDRICKGLAFKGKNGTAIVIIASGKSRVDNARFREVFGFRPTMLPAEQTEELVGHIAGTINPFCLKDTARLYLDLSIRKHLNETVFPGIGGEDSVVELTVKELEKLSDPVCWVAVTK
ncbi:MAG: YbaK/EbsC family protein [Mogibacterium sp.]|nr:YbaK/EbsC family protein [Mogibacterium sp.]MBR2541131.1 YbaK/EbsC family protein [Mogibacterium sp.]